MKYIKLITVAFLSLTMLFSSCSKDFMDTEYTQYLLNDELADVVAANPSVLDSYLPGAFAFLVAYNVSGNSSAVHDDFSHMSVMHSTDLMGQDIALDGLHWFQWDYEQDNRMFNYRRTLVNWTTYYTTIAKANEIMDLLKDDPTTPSLKGTLAHAYALRAFAYYYLIQLYQHPVTSSGTPNFDAPGVPMIYNGRDGLSDDEQIARKGRNTVRMVYDQIESDLQNALKFMEGYQRPNKNYMNLSVVQGLAARYYLLSQQWEKAAEYAKKAYAGYPLNKTLSTVNNGFYDLENGEWMWGFNHTTETSTAYASFFSHISNLSDGYAGLGYSVRLIDKALFESIPETDYRKSWFNAQVDNTQPTAGAKKQYANLKFGKIADWLMDYMYMRAPEMYLIEAEALAHMGREAEAAAALKPLMDARNPEGTPFATMSVEDVYQQRRIELWGEGFSFFDLKRLNKGIDRNYEGTNHWAGMRIKVEPLAVNWVYQIPNQEMQENIYLNDEDQNP